MKFKLLFIICLVVPLFFACNDDDNNPATSTTYQSSDITGNWKGEAKNSSNTISLDLTVAENGEVSGSGVSSTWEIDNSGKVTGGGIFSFASGGRLTVAASGWSLQLNSNKNGLTGKFNVAYSTLNDMDVSLTKE